MSQDTVNVLKQLLELGWPAIVTLFFGYLAVQYIADQRKQIDTLWARVIALETKLTAMERTVRDKQGIFGK